MLRARNCWLASRAFFGVWGMGLRTTSILYDPCFIYLFLFTRHLSSEPLSGIVSTATNEHFSCASLFAGSRSLEMHLIICSSGQTPSEKSTIDMELNLRFIYLGLVYTVLYRVLGD
ncbi:hypothetical protein DER46DRAFT_280862 [Fusarium sp. MPI-SDFR-AT-0072]|nr:hypothetical protein DER46DRAFT_280862 [Fusarium sp. MPI-SDFR-AT-0072]